jgi:predicted nucleic acid-binding protein
VHCHRARVTGIAHGGKIPARCHPSDFNRIEELETVIAEVSLSVESIPREALFLAGKVFLNYRRSRGTKHGVLPGFYIGAHAAVMQWPILTRDVGRFRTHFPTVPLITP